MSPPAVADVVQNNLTFNDAKAETLQLMFHAALQWSHPPSYFSPFVSFFFVSTELLMAAFVDNKRPPPPLPPPPPLLLLLLLIQFLAAVVVGVAEAAFLFVCPR